MQEEEQQQLLASQVSGSFVKMNNFLQLSPSHFEAAFWRSPAAVKLLKACDLICLTNAVFTSLMLIRTFGTGNSSGMSWHYQLPMILYACMNVTQLSLLLLKPNLHQAYRFQLTLASRSLRLLGIAWCSYHTGQADMVRMLGSVHNKRRATTGNLIHLMRQILVPPIAVFNHGCFVLAFQIVLPAQIWTFCTCASMMRTSTCVVSDNPDNMQAAQQICSGLRSAMYTLSGLLATPHVGTAAGAAGAAASGGLDACGGLQGVVMLGLYLHVFLLLVVPCLAIYLFELNMKLSFVRMHGWVLEHTWPIMDSRLIKVVVGYAAVVGGWMACEVAVLTVAPLRCSGAGLLTWSMPI